MRKNIIYIMICWVLGLLLWSAPSFAQVKLASKFQLKERQVAVNQLEQAGYTIRGKWDADRGKLFLTGPMTPPGMAPPGTLALDFLRRSNIPFSRETPETQLTIEKVAKNSSGEHNVTLVQVYRGVPVWGKRMKVHLDASKRVVTVNGQYINENVDLETQPKVNATQASATAAKHAGLDSNSRPLSEPKLVIYEHKEKYHLAWEFTFRTKLDSGADALWNYFIDAHSGNFIFRFDRINYQEAAEGSGLDCSSRSLPLQIVNDADEDLFRLQDTSRQDANGGDIVTNDGPDISSDADGVWDDTTTDPRTQSQQPEAAMHFYFGMSYDLLKKMTGRESYDGQGANIIGFVHAGLTNNAYWDGTNMIFVFGDGDGRRFNYWGCSKDVVAHEFMHAVTQFTAGLEYIDQSGALNEAYSDMWGAVVDPDDWLLAEDVTINDDGRTFLRDLADPKKGDQPDHFDSLFTGSSDNGGVHINSGIANKAFYLLANGDDHTTGSGHVCRLGIGRTDAWSIMYSTLENYLTPLATFHDWADATQLSAENLFSTESYELATLQHALIQVGLEELTSPLLCVEPSEWLLF